MEFILLINVHIEAKVFMRSPEQCHSFVGESIRSPEGRTWYDLHHSID
jgi:hypothetical protein